MKHDVAKYLQNHQGRFLLVNSMARRVRDLQGGQKPLAPLGADLEDTARNEFRLGKINVTTTADE
jgi:DNA-directed RNA polymerase subunit K/omega